MNVIPYNPVPALPYRRPSSAATARFVDILTRGGLNVNIRHRKGDRISAGLWAIAAERSGRLRNAGETPAGEFVECVKRVFCGSSRPTFWHSLAAENCSGSPSPGSGPGFHNPPNLGKMGSLRHVRTL